MWISRWLTLIVFFLPLVAVADDVVSLPAASQATTQGAMDRAELFSTFPNEIDPMWNRRPFPSRDHRSFQYFDGAGVRRALEEFYPDGKTLKTRTLWSGIDRYGNEIKNGPTRTWYPDGQLSSVTPYRDWRMDGRCMKWAPDGTIIADYTMKNGTGVVRETYPSGAVHFIEPWVDGRKNGLMQNFYESGKLQSALRYIKGKVVGPVKEFYENGRIKMFAYFNEKGQRHGPFLNFDEKSHFQGNPQFLLKGREVSREKYIEAAKVDPTLIPLPKTNEELKNLPDQYEVK